MAREGTPTSSTGANGVSSLFSTIGADISTDTVNSVISELNLFRGTGNSLPQWDSPQTTPTTSRASPLGMDGSGSENQGSTSSGSDHSHHSDPGTSSEHYNTESAIQRWYMASSIAEDCTSSHYPLTPPSSSPLTPGQISAGDTNNHSASSPQSESDPEMPPRKKRAPVPTDKKDDRYWERRKKNNIAAKRSRELRRKKIDEELKQAQEAIQENQKLKQEIEVLKAEINSLRRLLKDANMTLSLWIRAKQTAEPNAQLPPMLRGPNVPFVNFPVSSTV